MLPQFYRSTGPQYRPQQNAGLEAQVRAGEFAAAGQVGANIQNSAEQRAARSAALAASRGFREFDESRLAYLRGLAGRRNELRATVLDPAEGDKTGYEMELQRFPDWLNGEFDRIAQKLSTPAPEILEKRYNEAAPSWAHQAATILDQMDIEDLAAEMDELGKADRLSDAMQFMETNADRFSPADREKIQTRVFLFAVQSRMKQATDHLQSIGQQSGWPAAEAAALDPEFHKLYDLDFEDMAPVVQRLQTFVSQGKAAANAQLETDREKARDALNDQLAAGAITYDDIDASVLDENEQQKYVGWMEEDAARRASGDKIVTDEFARHQIKAQAIDITRGRVSYRDVVQQANAAKAAGKLDDEAYKDVLATARSELSSVQAESLAAASRRAERQLVSVTESTLERYAQLVQSGAPKAKDLLTAAESRRQFEYRLVDLHNSQLRETLKNLPDAIGDDIEKASRRILVGLRTANPAQRTAALDAWDMNLAAPAAPIVETFDPVTRQRIVNGRPAGPPMGLETIWDHITAEEQATVLQLLADGHSPESLIDHFQRQPALQE